MLPRRYYWSRFYTYTNSSNLQNHWKYLYPFFKIIIINKGKVHICAVKVISSILDIFIEFLKFSPFECVCMGFLCLFQYKSSLNSAFTLLHQNTISQSETAPKPKIFEQLRIICALWFCKESQSTFAVFRSLTIKPYNRSPACTWIYLAATYYSETLDFGQFFFKLKVCKR